MINLDIISKYLTPIRILDIGANTGQFHRLAKSKFPDSYIFSIEAENSCEPELKLVTNNYIITLLAKDNNQYEFYKLKSNSKNTGNSIYKELGEHYIPLNTDIEYKIGTRLDDLFDDTSVFDLIKIDTQGSELDIISGGINICKKAKGILLEVSLTQCNLGAPLINDVIKFMDNIGFENVSILDESTYKEFKQQDILFINKNI
jgi:FkbM family methyltransferase